MRPGFTLIETVVALVIAGLVVLGGRAILENVADGAGLVVEASLEAERDANAARLVRSLVRRVDAAIDGNASLIGNAHAVALQTWCYAASGWLEPCRARLAFRQAAGRSMLVVVRPRARPVVARRDVSSGSFLYLLDAREGGAWVREWRSTVTTPLALGIVMDGDTLIAAIGERG